MQLRYPSGHTGESYVRARAWRDARLSRCPNHPQGGCSFARHGTYARKTPRGTRIARWYCPQSHTTFSVLPDFLAARLPGTLDELEEVVAHAERAPSLLAAANALRTDAVALPGAMRWVRRRRVERRRTDAASRNDSLFTSRRHSSGIPQSGTSVQRRPRKSMPLQISAPRENRTFTSRSAGPVEELVDYQQVEQAPRRWEAQTTFGPGEQDPSPRDERRELSPQSQPRAKKGRRALIVAPSTAENAARA